MINVNFTSFILTADDGRALAGYIRLAVLLVYAAICAYMDYRFRIVGLPASVTAAAIGAVTAIYAGSSLGGLIISLLPGAVFLLMSLMSRGAVGMGDALFIGVCGLYMDIGDVLLITGLSWLACAAYALIVITKKRFKKEQSGRGIPFVTVTFVVMIILLAAGYWGRQ